MTLALYLIITVMLVALVIMYRFYTAYKKAYQAESTVNYFTTSLFGKNTIEDILWDVAKNCISQLHFEDCVIYLLDEEKQVLVQMAAYGPKNPQRFEIQHPIEIPLGKGITGTVALTGKAEIVNDTRKDSRYIVDDASRLSEITVPIISHHKVIGVIDSEHSREHFYTEKHLRILEKIAAICAVKIDKTKAEEKASRQEKEMQRLHQQLAELRLITLKSQMNPHFLFNCLNGIYNSIITGETQRAQEYLSNFARLLRMVLIHAEKNFISLQEEIDLLEYYLKLECLRTNNGFDYTFFVDPQISPSSYLVPGMLIQPFLENAIWHGLMNKEQDRRLRINWQLQEQGILRCEVEDNGIGRSGASRKHADGLKADRHQSKGIELCRERLELYQAMFNTQYSIEIEDLINEQEEPEGTRVSVTFEIDPAHSHIS